MDSGIPIQISSAIVNVKVYPVTLTGVQFTSNGCPSFTVSENEIPTNEYELVALNDGIISSQAITYTVVRGQPEIQNRFLVSTEGLITINGSSNFEERNRYDFLVRAVNVRGAEDFCLVTATINDVNEQPTFNLVSYRFNVSERVPQYAYLYSITANDPDLDSTTNGQLFYSLQLQGNSFGMFSIDGRGRIQLIGSLDYDLGPREYTFNVIATGRWRINSHYTSICAST